MVVATNIGRASFIAQIRQVYGRLMKALDANGLPTDAGVVTAREYRPPHEWQTTSRQGQAGPT
jgi:hypothetical protein